MSKKSINFTKMSEESKNQIANFKSTMVAIANESCLHSSTIRALEDKLKVIKDNRNNDLEHNMKLDEVIEKHSSIKVENEINREKIRHREVLKPLNQNLNDTYAFIPDSMYSAYVRKIEDGKRGDFLNAISQFLSNLGIDNSTDAQIRAMSERISDNIGAKVSNSSVIAEGGEFHSKLKERGFYKLFMSVFCDLYA